MLVVLLLGAWSAAFAGSWSSSGSSAGSWSAAAPVAAPLGCEGTRVASYNLNYGLAGDPDTLAAAVDTEADVLVLQEVTPEWVDVLGPAFRGRLRHQLFLPDDQGAGGLAVLSRYPLEQVAYVASPVGWFPGWIVAVDAPAGPFQVLAVHLHPPYAETGGYVVGAFTSFDERREELAAYLDALDPELPAVVAGDFNERRGPALGLLHDRGFVNVLPDEPTWRWDTPLGTLHNRFDHLYLGSGLVGRDGEVLDAGRSDHLPVRAVVCPADGA